MFRSWIAPFALLVAVASLASAQQQPPPLTLVRELRIDATEHDLSPFGTIAVLRNGSIAISQPQDHLIRFFDAKGAPLGTFGRAGEGPGEFRSIGRVGTVGDTLWYLDPGTRRTTYIGPDRKLLRSTPFVSGLKATATDSGAMLSMLGLGLAPMAVYSDGTFLTIVRPTPNGSRPPWYPADQENSALVRATSAGVFQRLVGFQIQTSPESCRVNWRSANASGGSVAPFCATGSTTFAPDGNRIGFALQDNSAGSPSTYTVIVVGARGDTLLKRSYPYTKIPIPKAAADSALASRLVARANGPPMPPEALAAMKTMKVPSTYPPLRGVQLGVDGTIWLRLWSAPNDVIWLMLDAKGDPIGKVTLPQRASLEVASREEIWLTEADTDGLQSLVKYRLERRQ